MRARIPVQGHQKKVMDMEIRKQLAEYDKKDALETDAMILWILYDKYGWSKKKLREFHDCFIHELKALTERYVMEDCDTVWLCTRKLKDAGIDILQWSEESKEDLNNERI